MESYFRIFNNLTLSFMLLRTVNPLIHDSFKITLQTRYEELVTFHTCAICLNLLNWKIIQTAFLAHVQFHFVKYIKTEFLLC